MYPEFLSSLNARFSSEYSPSLSSPDCLNCLILSFKAINFLSVSSVGGRLINWSISCFKGVAKSLILESGISIFSNSGSCIHLLFNTENTPTLELDSLVS